MCYNGYKRVGQFSTDNQQADEAQIAAEEGGYPWEIQDDEDYPDEEEYQREDESFGQEYLERVEKVGLDCVLGTCGVCDFSDYVLYTEGDDAAQERAKNSLEDHKRNYEGCPGELVFQIN